MKILFLLTGCLAINLTLAESLNSPDARVKDIINKTDNSKDLETINKIDISDYTMKDIHKFGKTIRKDLTAQQLETFLPEAISKTKGLIPSVYAIAKDVSIVGTETFIFTSKPHGFNQDDTILLIIENEGKKELKVKKVIDQKQFSVDGVINSKVFVHGKKIDDLRQVDYKSLNILSISAIQALHKSIQFLAEKNRQLVLENIELSDRVTAIEDLLKKEITPTETAN